MNIRSRGFLREGGLDERRFEALLGNVLRAGVLLSALLVLIATPVARVLVAWVVFVSQRDCRYTLVASLVLAALAYSLARH